MWSSRSWRASVRTFPHKTVTIPCPSAHSPSLDGGLDHHAFHEDAKPGDLGLQFGTRSFNSSKKFRMT